ncbi:MAG: mechanosensitive ion channel [bacterium]|nr:mechanosensitive ion channel [bacterium]
MDILLSTIPSIIAIILVFILVFFINRILGEKFTITKGRIAFKRVVKSTVVIIGIFFFVILLPLDREAKEQVFKLIGLIFTGILAFASTTFFSNLVSGLMIKMIKGYRVGDFIEYNNYLGRITEMDLLHVEIQTIERDLITIPNLLMIQNPIRTLRNSGTIICSTVTLGYDAPKTRIFNSMLKAAKKVGLENPWVAVVELGDYSVKYRVNGLLKDLDSLISSKSSLNSEVMDCLHEAGIEIVSPAFTNVRIYDTDKQFLQKPELKPESKKSEEKPDEILFDKALEAEEMEKLKNDFDNYTSEIEKLKSEEKKSKEEKEKKSLQRQIEKLELRKEKIKFVIERKEKEKEDN